MLAALNATVFAARIKSDDPVVILGAIVFLIVAAIVWSWIKRGASKVAQKGQQKVSESMKNRAAAKQGQSGAGSRNEN